MWFTPKNISSAISQMSFQSAKQFNELASLMRFTDFLAAQFPHQMGWWSQLFELAKTYADSTGRKAPWKVQIKALGPLPKPPESLEGRRAKIRRLTVQPLVSPPPSSSSCREILKNKGFINNSDWIPP